MEKTYLRIKNTPAIIWGCPSPGVYLFIHGQGGNKEEAETFSEIVVSKGWQVVSIDLPEHGERKQDGELLLPWKILPELTEIMGFIRKRWSRIALCANSIGAWLSLLSFPHEDFSRCLFISPILDMERLTRNMMAFTHVSESKLEQEKNIPTDLGQTLSWDYFQYVKENPIKEWNSETSILYGDHDHLTEYEVVEQFRVRFPCDVTVVRDGPHWFHTPDQLETMYQWMREHC